MKEAIVLAGGKGTRLSSVVKDVPKPMASVNGRPFLEYLLDRLSRYGFERVYLSVGHMADKIQGHFGGSYRSLGLIYVHESTPLGTGGGIRKCLAQIQGDHALVLNGDTYADLDLEAMENLRQISGKKIMGAVRVANVSRYGALSVRNGILEGFFEKGTVGPGLINVGAYVIGKNDLNKFDVDEPFSFETDYLQQEVLSKSIAICERCEHFIDIGIPEDYQLAQDFFRGRSE